MISYIAIIVTLLTCCQASTSTTISAAELTERNRINLLDKSLRRYSINTDHNGGDSNDNNNNVISKKSNRITNHLINKRQLLLVQKGDRDKAVEDEQIDKREMAPHLLSSFWNNDLSSVTQSIPSSAAADNSSHRRRLTNINEIIIYMKENYQIDLIEVQTNEIPSRTKISAVDGSTFSYGDLIDDYEKNVVYLVAANQDDFALLIVNMNSGLVQGVAQFYNGDLVRIQQVAAEEGRNINSWSNSLLDWDTWNQQSDSESDVNKIVITPYNGDLVESDCAEIYTDDTIGSQQEEGETNAIHNWSNSLTDSWDSWIEKHQAASDEISLKNKDDEAASFLQQIQHNKHTVSPKKKKKNQGHRYKHNHSDNRDLMEVDKISTTSTNQEQQSRVQLYIEIDSINVQDDNGKTVTKNVDYRTILASTFDTTDRDSEEDTVNNDMKCIYIPASVVHGNDITWSGSIIYMKQTTIPSDSEGTDSGLVLDNGSTSSSARTASPTLSIQPSQSLVPSESSQPSSQPSASTVPSLSSLPSSQPSQQPSYVPSESSEPR